MDYSKLTKEELIQIIKDYENENLNTSRDLFISNISHDVRTLLNAIYGNAQILSSDESLNHIQSKSVKRIIDSSLHMIDLINNIISISKNSGEDKLILSEFIIQELLENIYSVFKNVATTKGLTFNLVTNIERDYVIKTDKNKLFYILLNLLGNAFKYTESGTIQITCNLKKSNLFFEISDTGHGIDETTISSLSQNYMRGNNSKGTEGFGLGLGIVNKNLSLLGSSLNINSKVKKGSTFSFSIKCRKNSKSFESTQNNIFEMKEIDTIVKPNNFVVLIYAKSEDEISILKTYFSSRDIEYKFINNIKNMKKELSTELNKMLFINSGKLKYEELVYFRELKTLDLSIPLVSFTSAVMSEELVELNKISTMYILEPYSFIDIDQVLIMFSKEKFEYVKKEEEQKNYDIVIDANLIKDIIEEASLGNFKTCSDLIASIEDKGTKSILNEYLENYDFDRIVEVLKEKQKE